MEVVISRRLGLPTGVALDGVQLLTNQPYPNSLP